jgi:hypothetical protein
LALYRAADDPVANLIVFGQGEMWFGALVEIGLRGSSPQLGNFPVRHEL